MLIFITLFLMSRVEKGAKFGLKYFIMKTNTLQMYREVYKYTAGVSDSVSRQEMREFIRREFDRDCSLDYNEKLSEYKLGVARKKINELKYQIDMAK